MKTSARGEEMPLNYLREVRTMLDKLHPKYTLQVIPKAGRPYNPVHDEINGKIATVVDLTVGKRGWIAFLSDNSMGDDSWHRLHTSPIEIVDVFADGNITVSTKNTIYRLAPLAQR